MSTTGQALGDHGVGSLDLGAHGGCHGAEMMGTLGLDNHGGCYEAERWGLGVGKLWWVQGTKSQGHNGHPGTDFEHQRDTME